MLAAGRRNMTRKTDRIADILVIDDNDSDIALIRDAVNDMAAPGRLHAVTSAADALAFLRREGPFAEAPRPGLILLDPEMAGGGGLNVLHTLKADPQRCHIPVIALSAFSDPQTLAQSGRAHANCCIKKPVDFMTFKKTITVIHDFWLGMTILPPSR